MTFTLPKDGPHLLLAVSSHGFGHLSQVAPVVNQLRLLIPQLRVTVRGAFPENQIRTRVLQPDLLQSVADDFGMVMKDALTIDVAASLAAYQTFHLQWDQKVEQLAQELTDMEVDLVLADIPYLTLAAAQQAKIPCIALCSLNWADILEYSLSQISAKDVAKDQDFARLIATGATIVGQIRAIYQAANQFLLPAPSMPIHTLSNTLAIGPVCTPGSNRRALLALNTKTNTNTKTSTTSNEDCWFVLVGMGGMPFELNIDAWPNHLLGKSLYYIVADNVAQFSAHPNVIAESKTGLSYSDLVASADLIITKPGYGMFVEAAAAGVPVLYVERKDWPEALALTSWLESVAHCEEITSATLRSGDFKTAMQNLLRLGRYTPIPPTGNMQAAKRLAQYLRSKESASHG